MTPSGLMERSIAIALKVELKARTRAKSLLTPFVLLTPCTLRSLRGYPYLGTIFSSSPPSPPMKTISVAESLFLNSSARASARKKYPPVPPPPAPPRPADEDYLRSGVPLLEFLCQGQRRKEMPSGPAPCKYELQPLLLFLFSFSPLPPGSTRTRSP